MGGLGYGCCVLALLAGCVQSETDACGDGTTCRAGTFCVKATDDLYVCAPDDARNACTKEGLADGVLCRENSGRCYDGACVPIACGDRLADPGLVGVVPAEMCDDGNTVSGDGCSADCRSNERCGNGVVDPATEICDDGNLYSNDGCNVLCAFETPSWTQVLVGSPPAVTEAAMAYDPLHGEAILLGNGTLTYKLNSAWTAVAPPLQPETRSAAAMTYDAARRQVLMFGGDSLDVQSLADTWVWDGARWSLVDVGGPQRGRASIAYDARRERVVLFGGAQKRQILAPVYKDDTWEWDGDQWIPITTAVHPSARSDAAMAYDPVRGVTVLFGGIAGITRNAETWEYDGTWHQKTPATSPPPLEGAAMVAYHGQMLLFGGTTGSLGSGADTWVYDGGSWSKLTDQGSEISARRNMSMVYDSSRDRVVAFGGTSLGPNEIDASTYVFDGTIWKTEKFVEILPPGGSPRAASDAQHGRALVVAANSTFAVVDNAWTNLGPGTPSAAAHALAYDLERDEAVMIGGNTAGAIETFRMLSNGWTRVVPTPDPAPDGRTAHAIAYDRDRHEVVLYGGGSGDTDNDTWVWNGSSWALRDANSPPGDRAEPVMAFDPIHHQVIMFGGGNDNTTYAWDGTHWTEVGASVPTVARPIPRKRASMAWNPMRRRIVMYGGKNSHVEGTYLDDLWEWDGTRWTEVPLAVRPPPRTGGAFVPDTNGLGMYLFGGEQETSSPGELWELVWSSDVPRDRCLDLRDSDADGLAGCDDPDCWTVCHPLCEPGFACTGDPHCGDGVASPTETCRMCPGDTGGACEICGDAYCGENEDCAADCQ